METSLMQAASAGQPKGEPFKRPDISAAVPPQMKDAVDRVFAAGYKVMYSPEMADEREAAVNSTDPIPKRLAENVVGLTLTLDQQTKGGIPVEALFPAAMMLLSEAAEILTTAGQHVSDQDYKDAALTMFALIGKKLGGTDDQIMNVAKQTVAAQTGGPAAEPADPQAADDAAGMPPDDPAMPPDQAAPPADQPIPDAVSPEMPPAMVPRQKTFNRRRM